MWGRPIPNEELTPELLPPPDAPWSELVYFAGTVNGYDVLSAGPEGLMDFANPVVERFRDRGELPSDLTQLRVALFAEQRRDHFSDSASSPETMRYVHALVEGIRDAVTRDSSG